MRKFQVGEFVMVPDMAFGKFWYGEVVQTAQVGCDQAMYQVRRLSNQFTYQIHADDMI
jgi:hypothetical protein